MILLNSKNNSNNIITCVFLIVWNNKQLPYSYCYNWIMKRYYIIYKGQVQGVGFRWRLMQIAYKYNLTGYVRNLDNGDVETEIQGFGVDEFLKESLQQDYFIVIDDYAVKELDLVTNEEEYKVIY